MGAPPLPTPGLHGPVLSARLCQYAFMIDFQPGGSVFEYFDKNGARRPSQRSPSVRRLTAIVPAGDNEVEFFEFADAFGRKVDQGWEPG